jgi:ribosomal protein L24
MTNKERGRRSLANYSGDIKTGSLVKILSGNSKGKVGKVLEFNRKIGFIKVEGVCLKTHFTKNEATGTVVKEGWIPVCIAKKVAEESVNEK